ncbi:hypothetical protein [Glaciimonas immobilis]|uniref:Uncharacterized protein n=1 Tax=Glaciimonas immobilis TaxID=728004 RepID=A0A840RPV7_9BURK|nr:hypothetical protein [Glaciimonas immobilis]KAF3999196.1 hypothetical protein HAV38_04465 [Glaciimonas immobilis]MBB5198651.1 hypothetical protein [Glaciimonas immobilis]
MFAKSTYALLIDKLDLRNWFISRSHALRADHLAAVGEVLDAQTATFIHQLGGMAGHW